MNFSRLQSFNLSLGKRTKSSLKNIKGLSPKRQDLIQGASMVFVEILKYFKAKKVFPVPLGPEKVTIRPDGIPLKIEAEI